MKLKILFFLIFFLAQGSWADLCNMDIIAKAPIYSSGRLKPLNVFIKEKFKFYSLTTEHGNIRAFCENSLGNSSLDIQFGKEIQSLELIKTLQFNDVDFKKVTLSKVLPLKDEIKILLDQKKNKLADIEQLYASILFYEKLIQGEEWNLPVGSSVMKISNFKFQKELSLEEVIINSKQGLSFNIEYYLTKYNVEGILFAFSFISFCFALVFKSNLSFRLSYFSIFTSISLLLAFRILMTGRAPVTNMYETVLFSAWSSLVIPVIYLFRNKSLMIAATFFSSLCFLVLLIGKEMFSPNMDPLRPVLRDNFWLSTHVLTVVASYSIFSLSWLKANFLLIKKVSANKAMDTKKEMLNLIRWGCIFLSLGIFLGAIWADYSWGRFWAWDPKETWSLIALLFYIAILHINMNLEKLLYSIALAFIGIIMAWFGVNYLIASGLHSYGFQENGSTFTLLIILLQIFILLYLKVGTKNEQ